MPFMIEPDLNASRLCEAGRPESLTVYWRMTAAELYGPDEIAADGSGDGGGPRAPPAANESPAARSAAANQRPTAAPQRSSGVHWLDPIRQLGPAMESRPCRVSSQHGSANQGRRRREARSGDASPQSR